MRENENMIEINHLADAHGYEILDQQGDFTVMTTVNHIGVASDLTDPART